jgi:Probable lipoprotein LpqN
MKSTASINCVAIAIVALGIGVVGCGSTSSSNNSSKTTSTTTTIGKTSATTTTAKTQAKVAPRTTAPGPNPSIASYIQHNGITETPVHRGDPGTPAINLPIPDGWADAGPDTPSTAYWAIVDNGPEAAKYTPSIVVTVSKLVGNVDQQKLLDLAPGEVENLPGFKPMGDGSTSTLAGFPAYQLGGTWAQDGQTKAVAQKTVVIPAGDAVYLMRLNADCLEDQIGQALPATIAIDEQAKITV